MRKVYLLFATAAMLAASCANDDFSGDNNAALPTGDGSIAFNMNMPATSRADGTATDAGKLGNRFIVWGEKNETQTSGAAATAGNKVFENYKVEYTSSSANTTTSNTNNWEYVGLTPYVDTKVKPSILTSNANAKQTIKYWDDQASSYTFTAISALDSDINPTSGDAKVIIEKNTGTTSTDDQNVSGTVYDKGYTVTLKSGADTDHIFFSDRKNITKGTNGYDHAAVQMTFRNFMSKIRFGIYETVPGYKVVITGLKYTTAASGNDNVTTHTNGSTAEGGKTFGITGDFVVTGDATKYIVTYENSQSGNENKAKVTIDGTANKATYMTTAGTTWLSTTPSDPVDKTANAPTWDKKNSSNGGDYTTILPNPGNTTNLKLQISYKLISEDTGEVIEFKNGNDEIFRTVEVPAQYCTWKSNYAYTYLFKITDKSAELYPITFDAVVVSDQVGNQETITTVSEPSITTFATRTADGKTTVVTSENEYKGGDVIYAYAQDGTSTAAMSSSNMKLYKVEANGSETLTVDDVTEAAVDHALNVTTDNTKKLKVTEITSSGTESDKPSYESIPGEDGVNRTITGMKWTATAGTYYAVEYIKTTGSSNDTTTAKYYKIVKVASGN